MATLKVLPQGRIIQVPEGVFLFSALQEAGIPIASECGGQGRCGRCRVRFLEPPPPATEVEARFLSPQELTMGWRLACRHRVVGYITVEVLSVGPIAQTKVKSDFCEYQGTLRPAAVKRTISLPPRNEAPSQLERLQLALGVEVEVPQLVLSQLASLEGDLCSVTTVGRRVVVVEPGEHRGGPYGLAIDLGTSTLAGYLLDLGRGKVMGARAAANPQGAFGSDVLSRISYVQETGLAGLEELQRAAISGVNSLAEALAKATGIPSQEIVQVAVVGNPTMLHLLLRINPASIGQAPFTPVWRKMLAFRARELSLSTNPEALVHLLPIVSGYVGADTVAGILACGLGKTSDTELFVDLGANAEIVLAVDGKLLACAAAAGPAFEGVGIACGMPALEGAIFRVEIDGEVHYQTIGGAPPKGICGTGLVDAVAELLEADLVDYRGRLCRKRIQGDRFVLFEDPPVYITQGDIRKLQLAKAALRAGMEILAAHAGLSLTEVDRIFLAGAFGSEMRPQSLVRIGVLPPELLPRTISVGNAAGEGAKAFLFDREISEEVEQIAQRIEYIELSCERLFPKAFISAMRFPTSYNITAKIARIG